MWQTTKLTPQLSERSDQELAALAGQQPAAFTVLYQRYVKRVYAYCYSRVGHVQDAQDLTAQTFLAAFEGIGRYRGQGTLAAWLLGIAYHKTVDLQRRTQPAAPLDTGNEYPDRARLPDELILQQVQRETLENALRTLSPTRAEAIALRFFGELSHAEVAAVMGKPEAAVKMLVHRGLQDLRVRLSASKERTL